MLPAARPGNGMVNASRTTTPTGSLTGDGSAMRAPTDRRRLGESTMTTVDQAKAMAKRLRAALSARDLAVSHATTLELVAASLG
ncbi:glyoxalase superfamily protein, partial [Methylobacterium mesophilicum]|uniref:glyoxalase superfamily protein n=1 Tax=Methylobacterium mesophilicum TaxID=39956 RepID=UPI0027E55CB3